MKLDEYLKTYVFDTSPEEIDRVWENTRTYRTADSEVALLTDFCDGLKKSGYLYSKAQEGGEQRSLEFVIFKKEDATRVLEVLCKYPHFAVGSMDSIPYEEGVPAFTMRFYDGNYKDGQMGYHPSSVLTSEDLVANSELLYLLLREAEGFDSRRAYIISDSKNKEFTIEGYSGDILSTQRFGFSQEEALELAKEYANLVSWLNLPDKRRELRYMRTVDFEHERTMGGKLGIEFDDPYLTVEGKRLFEVGAMSRGPTEVRNLEGRLPKDIIDYFYLGKLESGEELYFPLFKTLV